jgi:YTH domain-containing protein 1
MTPTPPRPVINISSRAAELKAQLLVGRERASSATPPVGTAGQIAKQAGATEGSSLFRGSTRTPVMRSQNSEQELDINELISHHADSKPAADTNVMQKGNNSGPTVSNPQRPSSLPDLLAKSQVPSLGSPTKVTKPNNGKMVTNGFNAKNLESRHTSNASVSVGSEGEILEDAIPQKALPPTAPRETQAIAKPIIKDEQAPRKPSDEQPFENTQGRGRRDGSPPYRAPPSDPEAQSLCHIHDQRDETHPRQYRMPYPSDYKNDRRPYLPNSEKMPSQRQDVRDQNEDYRRSEIKSEQKREDISRSNCEARPPTLAKLLSHDEDLREWLEITGYHNGPYRDKILNRRRAIKALDAQRIVLLAEMAAEECGGVQAVGGLPTRSSAMPPSPIPEKVGDRGEPYPKSGNAVPESQLDGVASNKRPHSDIQDPRDEGSAGKMPGTNDRGPQIKEEEDVDYRCPRSSGYDSSRRRSIGDRGSSRERDMSPGRMAHESRPPARTRSYQGSDDFHSRDPQDEGEERERQGRGPRPFVVRGGYRGRAFDPNYRNRHGRGGRGRGEAFTRH